MMPGQLSRTPRVYSTASLNGIQTSPHYRTEYTRFGVQLRIEGGVSGGERDTTVTHTSHPFPPEDYK